ncbi:hypothetical protein VCRA2113O415_30111 [Vibrio crassostreae]|nr:hypothetical protein VCRA2110O182_120118 [Vibrio crassostreae]CAK1869006.1 hypothetical protein VCRA2117O328_10304 [Vibrio crassostreae]CAK2244541.1 hypothetical protein VCRA2111O408_110117 [Vibrio crassostreae]CAK2271035.1 hypothetical protein VCRA211O406_100003 [Vibrio crassostreae]CAK2316828.1 hypothetical protein VCRA2110O318_20120 [Vibrio crassostreae]
MQQCFPFFLSYQSIEFIYNSLHLNKNKMRNKNDREQQRVANSKHKKT